MSRQKGRSRSANDTEAVADRLHSAAIHLLRRLRQSDKASGISAARLSALSALVFGGPLTIGELANAEQVRPPTMTRLVQALESEGFVRRTPDPIDKRVVRLSATAKAKTLLEKSRRTRLDAMIQLMHTLSREEVKELGQAARLIEGLASRRES